MGELERLRQELAMIDQKLLEQFLRRMKTVDQVAEYKGKTQGRVFVPEQEARVIKEIEANTPPELKSYASVFVRTLMRLSRERQYQRLVDLDLVPIGVLQEAKARRGQVKTLVLPYGLGSDGTQVAQDLYPEATLVRMEDVGSACRQVADGSIDRAILPLTEELLFLLEKHALYIQACLPFDERYFAVGPELILPSSVQRVRFLILIKTMETLPLVINILGDLGLNMVQVQSLRDSSVCVEFFVDPASSITHRALYHIQQEAGEMRLLGCYNDVSLSISSVNSNG